MTGKKDASKTNINKLLTTKCFFKKKIQYTYVETKYFMNHADSAIAFICANDGSHLTKIYSVKFVKSDQEPTGQNVLRI